MGEKGPLPNQYTDAATPNWSTIKNSAGDVT